MKYKTAFRLAVRLIGVFLFFLFLPDLITSLFWCVRYFRFDPTASIPSDAITAQFIKPCCGTAAGAYLFFRGTWIIDCAIPSNRDYCTECGYELVGVSRGMVCPECGTTVTDLSQEEEPRDDRLDENRPDK